MMGSIMIYQIQIILNQQIPLIKILQIHLTLITLQLHQHHLMDNQSFPMLMDPLLQIQTQIMM